jgi:hypothetical protein
MKTNLVLASSFEEDEVKEKVYKPVVSSSINESDHR